MIYGKLFFFNHAKDSDKLNNLKNYVSFDNSDHVIFQIHDHYVGNCYNKDLGIKSSDLYFYDKSTGCNVVFLGDLYNRNELISTYKISANIIGNAELVYRLFQGNGKDFVNELNGDFTIIIFSANGQNVLIYRDHLGLVPFSYSLFDNSLWFSTDTISLCRALYKEEAINPDFFLDSFKFTDQTLTPNVKVTRLLPGHFIEMTSQSFKTSKYWFPEKVKSEKLITSEVLQYDMFNLVNDAVKIRLKDEPVATHLSGGLDSSSISAFVRHLKPEQNPLYCFSWSPDEKLLPKNDPNLKSDEREAINKTCQFLKAEPVFNTISYSDYIRFLSNPLEYSTYFHDEIVLRNLNGKGIRLLFSGYGGDEFISCLNHGINLDLILL